MDILREIAGGGMEMLARSEERSALFKSLSAQLSDQQRAILHRLQDEGDMEWEQLSNGNYYRGFCTGLWFAEEFLRRSYRI